jgi:hypothetical protein
MKLVNNMLAQVGRIAVIEALVLRAKAGLDPQTMVDVIGRATGNSVAFQYTAPRVVSRDFDGIRMDITYNDLELQTTLAKSLNVPLFLATICQQIYQMGRAAGLGGEDGAAIVKNYEQMTGVPMLLLDFDENRNEHAQQSGDRSHEQKSAHYAEQWRHDAGPRVRDIGSECCAAGRERAAIRHRQRLPAN